MEGSRWRLTMSIETRGDEYCGCCFRCCGFGCVLAVWMVLRFLACGCGCECNVRRLQLKRCSVHAVVFSPRGAAQSTRCCSVHAVLPSPRGAAQSTRCCPVHAVVFSPRSAAQSTRCCSVHAVVFSPRSAAQLKRCCPVHAVLLGPRTSPGPALAVNDNVVTQHTLIIYITSAVQV